MRAVRGELECPADIAGALLRRVSELAAHKQSKPALPELTPREWQVAGLIGQGLTNKEIAARLEIQVPTAKAHVHQVLAKLGASRRGEVVLHLPHGITQCHSEQNGRHKSARFWME
jgi:DNA-binding NarL/FixJ family response regulator